MAEDHDDEFLTTPETSEMLRTPVGTLYRWRQAGTGPPVYKVGKRTLYKRSDLERWLEGRRVTAVA
jgi:excisionase family DNA binding protein